MEKRYLRLLSREYPTEAAAAGEIVNLSAMRSLPKGTEYFFSDLHGEYDAFSGLLRSASGMIREKIDAVFGKSVSVRDRHFCPRSSCVLALLKFLFIGWI